MGCFPGRLPLAALLILPKLPWEPGEGRKEGKGKEELEMASSCSAFEQPDSQAAMRGALLQSLATRDPHTALTAAWLMEFGCLSSARQGCNCS